MGSHLEVSWAHFSVHISDFKWFFKIFSLMNNGSTLIGARISYECDEVDINLGMTWVYSGTPPYGHLSNTVTSLLQVYVDCGLWNWNLPDNWK